MNDRCGLSRSGDYLGGCDPNKRCVGEKIASAEDLSEHDIDCTCIFCIPGA